MTTRHLVSTIENIEAWHKPAKEDHFVRNSVPTKTLTDYTDRKTGTTEDITMGLSVTGTNHMDRIFDPIYHPDYPTTNLALVTYDDTNVLNDEAFVYTTTQSWRDANTGSAILDKSTAEAEALGFDFGEEE